MTTTAPSRPVRVLGVLLGLAAVLQLQVLELGFSGPEMLALSGPETTRLGSLVAPLFGQPFSPLVARILSLVGLGLAALGVGSATRSTLGSPHGRAAGLVAAALLFAAPVLAAPALDVRGLAPLVGLAALGFGLGLQLRPKTTVPSRLGALTLAVLAGAGLGWPAPLLLLATIAVPYRHRAHLSRQGFVALSATALAALGASQHAALAPHELNGSPLLLAWCRDLTTLAPPLLPTPLVQLALTALVTAGFFLLSDRRRAILILVLLALGAPKLAGLPGGDAATMLGGVALAIALAISSAGLLEAGLTLPRRFGAVALGLALVLATLTPTFELERAASRIDTWRQASLETIQRTADEVARDGLDTEVFVLAPPARLAGLPALGPGLALALAPPFSSATVPVRVLPDESSLLEALDKRRGDPAFLTHALFVLGASEAAVPLAPIEPLAPLRPGWKPPRPGARPLAQLEGPGTWRFSPPVPAHALGALSLPLPKGGLSGRLTLDLGETLTGAHETLAFDLAIPPPPSGSRADHVELLFPATLAFRLSAPLVGLHFDGAWTSPSLPTILAVVTRPSLLEPAPGTRLDLSRSASPPRLHIALDPTLPRPSRFELGLDVAVPGGTLELSASGPVPAGLGGDLWLTPTHLGPRAPELAMARSSWQTFLATGLSQSLERAVGTGGTGPLTLWVHLFGPGGLDLGSTPPQVHSFLATPP
jgi:hypothetical protein